MICIYLLLYVQISKDEKNALNACLSSRFLWIGACPVKSKFIEYLNHVKLGHVPGLTRVELGII
jgi:hypothetical protein